MPDQTSAPVQPPPPQLETIAAWSAYAKDRFDAASKRVDEFRNWARQLAGAVGVVIGFELTLIGRILDLKPPFDADLRSWSLRFFLLAVSLQILLLLWILRTGYYGHQILGPESPTILAQFIADADETKTKQIIGAYYARAYDQFHSLSERLAKAVATTTSLFTATLLLLVIGIGLLVRVAATAGPYNQGAMAEPAKPATPAPAPSAAPSPAPQAPAAASSVAVPTPTAAPASSILVTPTPGEYGKFSADPTPRKK